jgi:serine/threonine protein kinase/Tol biopolymer transport system component
MGTGMRFALAVVHLGLHDSFVQELSTGTLLGHYRVVRPLGQGGMGVVYEAEDQRLGRSVAIKLLPEGTRRDPTALERFWREARTASSLNHAGICTIYELNESGDQPFIVMELLEGQSLDKAHFRRPMPYPKLLDFGVQVADALDAAHRKGILHRDIKPGNIFLSPSGQVKILDFGLAKLEAGQTSPNGANGDKPNDTLAGPLPQDLLTSPGAAVGTIAYMSPEQARGETLDARSDVFSLGVVLYELATGQHPFSGSTTAVTFDRILNYAPTAPISLNSELPGELEEILNKTLEKDRELRCQSAAELRADLKRLQRKSSGGSSARPSGMAGGASVGSSPSSSGSGRISPPPSAPSGSVNGASDALSSGSSPGSAPDVVPPAAKKSPVPAIALWALVLLAAAGFAAWRLWPRAVPFTSISLSQITNTGTLENVALSGDGKFLAEVKNGAGQRTLWIRNIATNTDTQILAAFPSDYVGLSFSPDANYLFFVRGTAENTAFRSLFMMPTFGGTPRQLIHDIDSAPSLSPDGSRLVYLRWTPGQKDHYSEIHTADKDGANDQVIYTSNGLAEAPAWSPQPNQIAWIEQAAPGNSVIHVFDLSSKTKSSIAQPQGSMFGPDRSGSNLAWLPDGKHLLVLYAKAHSDRGQIGIVGLTAGDFHTVTNDVNAYSQLAVSADGKTLATVLTNQDSGLAYYKGDGGAMISSTPLRVTPSTVAWADEDHQLLIMRSAGVSKIERASGTLQPIDTGDIDDGIFITTCPNGTVLFTGVPKGGAETRLFRMNGDGSGMAQITNAGIARMPYCTPDSQAAYFTLRQRGGGAASTFWSIPVSGGTPQQELKGLSDGNYFVVSRDAKLAVAESIGTGDAFTALIADIHTGQVLHQLTLNMSALGMICFSPDGKAIVRKVVSNGGNALQYQPIDGSAPHLLMGPTPEDLTAFAWSPSGNLLAVLQLRRSSDVVLINDLTGKQPH